MPPSKVWNSKYDSEEYQKAGVNVNKAIWEEMQASTRQQFTNGMLIVDKGEVADKSCARCQKEKLTCYVLSDNEIAELGEANGPAKWHKACASCAPRNPAFKNCDVNGRPPQNAETERLDYDETELPPHPLDLLIKFKAQDDTRPEERVCSTCGDAKSRVEFVSRDFLAGPEEECADCRGRTPFVLAEEHVVLNGDTLNINLRPKKLLIWGGGPDFHKFIKLSCTPSAGTINMQLLQQPLGTQISKGHTRPSSWAINLCLILNDILSAASAKLGVQGKIFISRQAAYHQSYVGAGRALNLPHLYFVPLVWTQDERQKWELATASERVQMRSVFFLTGSVSLSHPCVSIYTLGELSRGPSELYWKGFPKRLNVGSSGRFKSRREPRGAAIGTEQRPGTEANENTEQEAEEEVIDTEMEEAELMHGGEEESEVSVELTNEDDLLKGALAVHVLDGKFFLASMAEVIGRARIDGRSKYMHSLYKLAEKELVRTEFVKWDLLTADGQWLKDHLLEPEGMDACVQLLHAFRDQVPESTSTVCDALDHDDLLAECKEKTGGRKKAKRAFVAAGGDLKINAGKAKNG